MINNQNFLNKFLLVDNRMELNKRGQGLSVNAIILIVLGVFVLAILIIGFTLGWGTLKDKIAPSNNVKTIVDSCSVACSISSQFDFCLAKRDLKVGDDSIKDVTCNYLAKNQTKYGIGICGSICDATTSLSNNFFDKAADISCTDNAGKTVYALSKDGKTLLSKDCPIV